MLKTPESMREDPITASIAQMGGRQPGYRVIEEGVVEIGHFSLDIMIWGSNAPKFYMGYPEFPGLDPNCYGVCDKPEQFLEKYREILQKDERTFVVSFTHITKNPENKGRGGGWRWHKWGPYIGTGEPQCEYLDDEEGFNDGIYVYHILQLDGPALGLNWKEPGMKFGPLKDPW